MLGWLFGVGKALAGTGWERTHCPGWVNPDNDTLRSAWERERVLIYRGRTYEYRVTPRLIAQGHWGDRVS